MSPAISLAVLMTALLASCGRDEIETPSRNLERPLDLALVCSGNLETGFSALPLSSCRKNTPSPGPRMLYGFLLNSAKDQVALVDVSNAQLVDLDPATPGYDFLPVGTVPVSLAASADGCRVVTANSASCDLSLLDSSLVIAPSRASPQPLAEAGTGDRAKATDGGTAAADGGAHDTAGDAAGDSSLDRSSTRDAAFPIYPRGEVSRVVPSTSRGPLRARPGLAIFVPPATPPHENACRPDDPYSLYVTFPRCGLVAEVEVKSGRIRQSLYLTPSGLVDGGTDPVCPEECTPLAPVTDGGARDAAARETGQPADTASPDRARPEVAADLPWPVDQSNRDRGVGEPASQDVGTRDAGSADLAAATAAEPRIGGLEVAEDNSALFVAAANLPLVGRVAIRYGRFTADRLLSTLEGEALGVTRLRLAPDTDVGRALYAIALDRTLRVLDAPTLAECDTNVDALAFSKPPTLAERGCLKLADGRPRRPGALGPGISLSASGDTPADVAFLTLPRDATKGGQRGPSTLVGTFGWVVTTAARIYVINLFDEQPLGQDPSELLGHRIRNSNNLEDSTGPDSGIVSQGKPATAGSLEQQSDEGQLDDQSLPLPVGGAAGVSFPDQTAAWPETWTFDWRGTLPGTTRSTGHVVRLASAAVALDDPGAAFCKRGVLAGDELTLRGCESDDDCGYLEVCRRDAAAAAGVLGLCLPQATADRLVASCRPLMLSARRYRIAEAAGTRLTLAPLQEAQSARPEGGCASDASCALPGSPFRYRCELPTSGGDQRRCIKVCAGDRDCGDGAICDQGGRCIFGPLPDPACFPELTNYAASVGEDQLLVMGSSSGFEHRVIEEASGRCVESGDPDRARRLGRLPRRAPSCDLEPRPNPCEGQAREQGGTGDGGGIPADGHGGGDGGGGQLVDAVFFANQAFSMAVKNLRAELPSGYHFEFTVTGGYSSYGRADISAMLPATLIGDLGNYILYLVDSGRETGAAGVRGQLLKLDPSTMQVDQNFVVR